MVDKLYFIGEYGFGFRQLFPFLEQYNKPLEILTWDSLVRILHILWPGRFNMISVELFINNINESLRDCNHYRDDNINKKFIEMGFSHCFNFDKNNRFFYDNVRKVYNLVKPKLMYGEQFEEKKFVSIFPRNRKIQPNKNITGRDHIKWLKYKFPNKKIMGHGLENERFNLNIDFCRDIYHQINVLNNSEVFITPASGMADLGLMCGCNIILTDEYETLDKVNYHSCKIDRWENL